LNAIVSSPPARVIVTSSQSDLPLSLNTAASSPPTRVIITSSEEAIEQEALNTVVTKPPVEVNIPVDPM
jgi:hypothetical protein